MYISYVTIAIQLTETIIWYSTHTSLTHW